MTPVPSALHTAAALGLRCHTTRASLDDDEAHLVLQAAEVHGVTGLLAHGAGEGVIGGPEWFLAETRERHLAALRTSMRCEHMAVHAVRTLSAAGIRSRTLKGVALAHLDYPDPAWRTFGDADVLVPRAALPAALAALRTAGFVRPEPPVRGWWERSFGKAVVLHSPEGVELDLHLTLTGGYYGLCIPSDELFAGGEEYTLAEVAVTALPRPLRLLQAAYHAVLGGGSGLRALRDVAQLADDATLEAAMDVGTRWRGGPILAEAIRRAWAQLALADGPAIQWAASCALPPADAARIAAAQGGTDGWAADGRAAAAALRPAARVAYTAGLLFPSRASLRARDRSPWEHLRRVLTAGRSVPMNDA